MSFLTFSQIFVLFQNWYAKTPMGKKRALALMGGNTGSAKDKGQKGKMEKKKK